MLQDFKENHVKDVDLKPADLAGASLKHLLNDDNTGEEIWWDAEVVDIDLSSKNLENPISLYHTNEKEFFLNWDLLHARLKSHYEAWSYKKKSTKKITEYRKSL